MAVSGVKDNAVDWRTLAVPARRSPRAARCRSR